MAKPKKATGKAESKPLRLQAEKGETKEGVMARALVEPYLRHGILASDLSQKSLGNMPNAPSLNDYILAIKDKAVQSREGKRGMASDLLTAQAFSLDAMMTELMRRAAINLGDYPLVAERYARLAFKAQSNSRATLEALAKLHHPRERTVRHVHVNQGAQAVVTDNFHHHMGGKENAKTDEQPHATGTAGKGKALSGQDAQGNGVPISGGQGESAMQNARGKGKRRAKGQS